MGIKFSLKMTTLKPQESKKLALGLGVVLVGIVFGMGVYLPFYSPMAKAGEEARRQFHLTNKARKQGTDAGVSSSMWKNIEKSQ